MTDRLPPEVPPGAPGRSPARRRPRPPRHPAARGALLAILALGALAGETEVALAGPEPVTLGAAPVPPSEPLSIVRHRWQVVIAASNQVAIRPGSVYDIVTYFEELGGWPRPRFNYLFLDTGLGTAEPIYPVFQRGYQASWTQLLPAMLSERNRHIDHRSVVDTPDGCRVYSAYWVRHIDEFPDQYERERAEGYTLVDISFNHYVRLRPDAQCGRHRGHDPDPAFDPIEAIWGYRDSFTRLADIPPPLLARYEAKIGLLKLVSEEFDRDRWPRFAERYEFRRNSLWYYPDGVPEDYGLTEPRPLAGTAASVRPRDLLWPADEELARRFPLRRMLGGRLFGRVLELLDGRPVPGFDPAREPGGDALRLADVGPAQYYTSGLDRLPMTDVEGDVRDPGRYRLVEALVRPAEEVAAGPELAERDALPQLRLVYQLMAPGEPARPLEQLYLHLSYDLVDRRLPRAAREKARRAALEEVARTGLARAEGDESWRARSSELLERLRRAGPTQVSFSSALTGIWIFGRLERYQADPGGRIRDLGQPAPVRIRRQGVDVGYYSSVYDTVLFREALARLGADGRQTSPEARARREGLGRALDALTPRRYRDPRRSDPELLRASELTCAQCHQMAGRDGVHVALNDHIDRRFTAPVRVTEYLYRELDRQLRRGSGDRLRAR